MIKRNKIPTILGIIILIAAVATGVFFINSNQIFRIGAKGASNPKDIRVSNITDSSFAISWTTDKETSGFVIWDKGTTSPDDKGYTHLVNLTGLNPSSTYTYKINSDGTVFDNDGIPWKANTSASGQTNVNSDLISGSVLTATGRAVEKALVYIDSGGALFSTLTSSSGNFVFQIPAGDSTGNVLQVFVQAGPLGTSSAQVYSQSAKPIPPMILGSTHDFRNLPPSSEGGVPGASLNLPADKIQQSRFSIPEAGTPKSEGAVTLNSVSEGETVTSTRPEFFGDGPVGASLSIKVESENPISDSISINSKGSWKWSPPENLSPGAHKIVITWKDISGITRTLTKNFIVQAGEAPAFESSGSAQTATPTPTSSPKATTTSIPTVSPIPDTGSLTPTFLLSIMGVAVTAFGFVVWKYAQSI